jgi:hypothetical protein
VVPLHAWVTCVVLDEGARVPSVLANYSQWYTALDSLLGKTIDPKDMTLKMPTQTMTRPYLSRH